MDEEAVTWVPEGYGVAKSLEIQTLDAEKEETSQKIKEVWVLNNLTFTDAKWQGILSNPKKNTNANCEAYLEGNKIRFVVRKGMMKKEIFWSKTN